MKSPNEKNSGGMAGGILNLGPSIRTKIIFPYVLLTLLVAVIGAYIVTRVVTLSLRERFVNQLTDAIQVVGEGLSVREERRLGTLRSIAYTAGLSEAVERADVQELRELAMPQVVNNNPDSVVIVDMRGVELLGYYKPPGAGKVANYNESVGADMSSIAAVRLVLTQTADTLGDKHVSIVNSDEYGEIIYAAGPILQGDKLVGAVMVGDYMEGENGLAAWLKGQSLADVTVYDTEGRVLATTLSGQDVEEMLEISPRLYQLIVANPKVLHLDAVDLDREAQTTLDYFKINITGREYEMAYGMFMLRNETVGVFSVALPQKFFYERSASNRNMFAFMFVGAMLLVIGLGFSISQLIVRPILRLVDASKAIASGDLDHRTRIKSGDEIGVLSQSFDRMAQSLKERNEELRQLLQLQREEASKVRAILTSIADGVIVQDDNYNIVEINPTAEAIIGELRGDIEIIPIDEGFGARPGNSIYWDEFFSSLKYNEMRRFRMGNRVLSALAAPVILPADEEDAHDTQLGTVVVLRDITRETEADRLKDDFITSISHELRTPLAAIKGYSDLLLMMSDGSIGERQLHFVTKIQDNTEDLIHQITQLIDITQIESGTLGLDLSVVDLVALVRESTEKWRNEIDAKDLYLKMHLPETEIYAQADYNRLEWALSNLLSNAHQYTLEGGVEVRLEVKGEEATISVIDTGVGIQPEHRKYLFTRFFRAVSDEVYGTRGVGLGLFIARSVMEAHGGRVDYKTEVDKGSTFNLVIPLRQEMPEEHRLS